MSRMVYQFSCGAASAVATKLGLAQYGHDNAVILNAFIEQEHEDNRRFAADCEKWFDHPVIVLRDEKYGASTHTVWERKRYMKGMFGAPCSLILKREVIEAACLPDDTNVFGFTADKKDVERAQRFLAVGGICPLIERNLTKSDCLAIIERVGIELPFMYRAGFNNANCIGCVKGGEGYWNKVREVFPQQFYQIAAIQQRIGPGAYLFRNRNTGERFSLLELPRDAGRHNETVPECSFYCESAEEELDLLSRDEQDSGEDD